MYEIEDLMFSNNEFELSGKTNDDLFKHSNSS
jgi:hypothetical protein